MAASSRKASRFVRGDSRPASWAVPQFVNFSLQLLEPKCISIAGYFNCRKMAELTAATKAELALVLPSLMVVTHLERNEMLPSSWLPLSKTYRRSTHLGNGASIQLTSPDSEEKKAWSDRDIIEHLVVSKSKVPSSRAVLVSGFSVWLSHLVLIFFPRSKNGYSVATTLL